MFASEDVQEVFRLIPPSKTPLPSAGELSDRLPSLLLSSTGTGFVTSTRVSRQFETLIDLSSDRLSVASVSRELDVDHNVVLQIVRASPSLVLLSENKSNIISKDERDRIEQQLRELLKKHIVSKSTFSQENDVAIESIDILTHALDDTTKLRGDIMEVEGHVVGTDYHYAVLEIMKQRLNEALRDAVPVEFSSNVLLDCPMWYITFRLNWLLKVTYMASQFRIEPSTDKIRCIPKKSVVQKRDAEIARLQAGDVPNIDLQAFSKEYNELYPSSTDLRDYIRTLSNVFSVKSTAISETWLHSFSEKCAQFLDVHGYVDFTTNIKDYFPADCHKELFDAVEQQISTSYKQQQSVPKLYRVGDFITTEATFNRERDVLLDLATTQATTQWAQLKENQDKDLKLQMSEIFNSIPSDQPILALIAKEKAVEKAVDDQYWSEIVKNESENETEFSIFWKERVVSRIHVYSEGLKIIEDSKLREQLADLLSTYIHKELVADAEIKARSQGLLLSRKTRKNVQKFESTLKGKLDLSSLLTAVEKFAKKQGISEINTASLTETKDMLVGDMIRKMQKKQADGPLLFLTLVIVLLAKQQQGVGVVYATGKFAPKLLKQLKLSLSAERYEQLEGWKEKAKAGTLSTEDKENMKSLAGEL